VFMHEAVPWCACQRCSPPFPPDSAAAHATHACASAVPERPAKMLYDCSCLLPLACRLADQYRRLALIFWDASQACACCAAAGGWALWGTCCWAWSGQGSSRCCTRP
jgi:hypothetical protein